MTNPQTEIPSTTFYKEMSKIVVNISDNHDATGTPTRVLMAIDAIHKLHQFELKKELTKAADTAREDEREICKNIFTKNVDWAEWAMSECDAEMRFDEIREAIGKDLKE